MQRIDVTAQSAPFTRTTVRIVRRHTVERVCQAVIDDWVGPTFQLLVDCGGQCAAHATAWERDNRRSLVPRALRD